MQVSQQCREPRSSRKSGRKLRLVVRCIVEGRGGRYVDGSSMSRPIVRVRKGRKRGSQYNGEKRDGCVH